MIYRFKKNRFYPRGWRFGLMTKNEIKFEAKFDPSCIYDLKTVDNYDVNKLFGFSTGWHHHFYSLRIGWRCLNNENIEILTYVYEKGKRKDPMILGTVKPDEEFECNIKNTGGFYTFRFKNTNHLNSLIIPVKERHFPIQYLLYPYFGGNNPAPHDMKLEVIRIKK